MEKAKWQGNGSGQETVSRHVTNSAREIGTLRKLKLHLGYAFIQPDDGGEDVFVSVAELQQTNISAIRVGTRVSFRRYIKSGDKHRATDLQLCEQRLTERHNSHDNENSRRGALSENASSDEWLEGTIKWFNAKAGYGFVTLGGEQMKDAFLPRQMVQRLGLDTRECLEKVPVMVKVDDGRKPGTIEVVFIKHP